MNWDIAASSELIIVHKIPTSTLNKVSGASGMKYFVTFAELLEYSSLLEVFKHHWWVLAAGSLTPGKIRIKILLFSSFCLWESDPKYLKLKFPIMIKKEFHY